MALTSAAKNLEDDDYSDCWDLLAPQPPDPEPPKTKAPNIYKVTDAHVNIGGHPADSYTYPLAIDQEPGRLRGQRYLLDRRIMINGAEYLIVSVDVEDVHVPMDSDRRGNLCQQELTIRARRI